MVKKAGNVFINTTVNDISTFIELAVRLDGYLFRGQPAKYHCLSTSLERLIGDNLKEQGNVESAILKQFKARAHHFIPHPPDLNDNVEWLALLQHHGGPTRLIDVTESIFIATYFAIMSSQKEDSDACVWGISEDRINNLFEDEYKERQKNSFPVPPDLYTIIQREALQENINGIQNGIGSSKTSVNIAIISPQRVNERMVAQKAKFIAPFELRNPFIRNFSACMMAYTKDDIKADWCEFQDLSNRMNPSIPWSAIRFRIPKDIFPSMLKLLDKMNINEATLFPGLDGFARSLQTLATNSKNINLPQEKKPRTWKYYEELFVRLDEERSGLSARVRPR
ncbi:MAG: hypothetical protein A2017_01110 [Lentisphaerae bacterium GWF2_44_16]|nr:MAG: hypothetical protein A2017_01110 [Lentisphaerae bacterium GWF2_44_16]